MMEGRAVLVDYVEAALFILGVPFPISIIIIILGDRLQLYCSELKPSRSTTGAPAPLEPQPFSKADLGRRSNQMVI